MKPYYDKDGITIYHGDCREILPTLPKVDLVLTDPPYGVGLAKWDADLVAHDWLTDARAKADLVLFTPGIANLHKYPAPDWVLCWFKPGSTRRNGTGGFNHWEPVLQFGKHKWMVDAINLPDCANHAEYAGGHPCPKPLALARWLLSATQESGQVIDPFMGSGTTLVAARNLNRRAIGIEIEERYCEIAARRLAQGLLPMEA